MPVVAAVIAGGERRVVGVPAGQQPRGQRDTGDDPDPGGPGGGQHLVQRLTPECVEDDLHAGHGGPGDCGQCLVAGFHADPVRGDALLGYQRVQRIVNPVP